jgi:hypothetical protein
MITTTRITIIINRIRAALAPATTLRNRLDSPVARRWGD